MDSELGPELARDSKHQLMEKLLAGLGHRVHAAASVGQAKALAKDHHFDLIISDLGLPDGNGHALMACLKEQYGLRGIALSGFGTEDDLRRSEEAGFAEHLSKPLNLDQLEAAVARVTDDEDRRYGTSGEAKAQA